MFFKTFKEARDYIKNDPSGKSLVRLDNGSGYKVKSLDQSVKEVFQLSKTFVRSCEKCGAGIPDSILEEFPYRTKCNSCTKEYLSKFGAKLPKDNKINKAVKQKDSFGISSSNNGQFTSPDINTSDRLCVDCECNIPQARVESIPNAVRCASCQSKFEKSNPESVTRKVKEGGILTREGAKRMRAKQYGANIHNKI